ncbi:uncharacterized protein LOC126388294 isoform X2 [Epinephelus moara]|uniref:uncharacterized protein LOC126388294 isoform X2 n=1 Tax=Epinephelus moara TaxID=300413 RepID=UPI00214E3C64|nr:uncharacterized protein LOC126388294 isoform X2 [Epinephelus moara]
MSQRKTTRVIKKRIYPDCVEGPNFPSPPKRFQKGSNTTASKGPVPQQPSTALVQNIPKTTTTTKDNLYSMDLFASEKPERSIDLPESPTEQPESSIEQPESSMEMSKSWHPPADDVDDDDDDNITQLSSVSSATLKTVLTAPKYTSTPVNTGGKTPRVRTAARTPEGCDRRSPIHTPVRTPQGNNLIIVVITMVSVFIKKKKKKAFNCLFYPTASTPLDNICTAVITRVIQKCVIFHQQQIFALQFREYFFYILYQRSESKSCDINNGIVFADVSSRLSKIAMAIIKKLRSNKTPSPESKRRASVSKTVRTPQGNRGGSQRPKNPSIPVSEGSCGDPNGHPG